MADSNFLDKIDKRRTFAIISHPDAGKTTLTEKLLLLGGAIQLAGTVKARKSSKHATSDWMELEKQRGISVTSSVMQFPYRGYMINLLDTPGHEDFSEDTYRTLTAVDSVLMVIDSVKGVESRTIKLLEVCRLRNTPIFTFINKLDRDSRDPIDLLDEIETVLGIQCVPVTWPIGMGKSFQGVYHLNEDRVYWFEQQKKQYQTVYQTPYTEGLTSEGVRDRLSDQADSFYDEIELLKGASHKLDQKAYQLGQQTPVFFGTALANFGIDLLLDMFIDQAPGPMPRQTVTRVVEPQESNFSGFVFKIQANMDPAHRDRIAFLRVCSGQYYNGIKAYHSRLKRDFVIRNALTFMAGERELAENAQAGDIIGIHNHGTIQIGDSFTVGESLQFTGIPYFAPELFRRVRLQDPLKSKALHKGLLELSEEGATQIFYPYASNDLILGAVGILQFDVVAYRLKHEYNVACSYENVNVTTVRWVHCDDEKRLEEFLRKNQANLAKDGANQLAYLAPTWVNLNLTQERWPDIDFQQTREHFKT